MMCDRSAFFHGRNTTCRGTTVPKMRVEISMVVKCAPSRMAPRPLASAVCKWCRPCTSASLLTLASLLHQGGARCFAQLRKAKIDVTACDPLEVQRQMPQQHADGAARPSLGGERQQFQAAHQAKTHPGDPKLGM